MELTTKGGKSVEVARSKVKPKRVLTNVKINKGIEKMFEVFRIRQSYQYFARLRFHHIPRIYCYPKDDFEDFTPILENDVVVGGVCGVLGCGKSVSHKGYYYTHIRDHHPDIRGNHFFCGICGKRFKLIIDAIDHVGICDLQLYTIPSDAIFVLCREVKPRSKNGLVKHGWYRQDAQSCKKRIIANDGEFLDLYRDSAVERGDIVKNHATLDMFERSYPPLVYLSVFDEGYFPFRQKRKVSDYVIVSNKRRNLFHKLDVRRCGDVACFEEEIVVSDNPVEGVNTPQNTDSIDDHSEDIEEVIEPVEDVKISQNADSLDDLSENIEEVIESVGDVNTSQNIDSTDDHIEVIEEIIEPVEDVNTSENIDSTDDHIETIEEIIEPVEDVNISHNIDSTDDHIETIEEVVESVEDVTISPNTFSTDDHTEVIEEFIEPVEDVNNLQNVDSLKVMRKNIKEIIEFVKDVNNSQNIGFDDQAESMVESIEPVVEVISYQFTDSAEAVSNILKSWNFK